MKESTLPSGAKLKITLSDFAKSRRLFQIASRELKGLKLNESEQVENFIKDLFCTMIGSEELEQAVWACADRTLYNNLKATEAIFEDENARQDYVEFLITVAKEHLMPFMSGLSAQLKPITESVITALK